MNFYGSTSTSVINSEIFSVHILLAFRQPRSESEKKSEASRDEWQQQVKLNQTSIEDEMRNATFLRHWSLFLRRLNFMTVATMTSQTLRRNNKFNQFYRKMKFLYSSSLPPHSSLTLSKLLSAPVSNKLSIVAVLTHRSERKLMSKLFSNNSHGNAQ